MQTFVKTSIIFILLIIPFVFVFSQKQKQIPVFYNNQRQLEYTSDDKGNRVPDFSYCGYKASETKIPDVPVKIIVPRQPGDMTEIIQQAINHVSSLPIDENGFHGTILLEEGTYAVQGRLKITNSGIILRGSGTGKNRTVLLAAGISRETLIRITGENNSQLQEELPIIDSYIPVNSTSVNIKEGHNISAGDQIIIRRPVIKEWIDILDMNSFGGETEWLGWKPERNKILWDRTVVAVDKGIITFDAPITTSLDANYGGGFVSKYAWPGRINNIGIENLSLKSDYDTTNLKDEEHCWMAITIENAIDCWVRQVNFENFTGSAVAVFETARRVTVEDCISTHPVSEIGGQRRYTFFTSGQQTLFQRCYAEYGYHDFSVGNFAPGPNAFVQCKSHLPYSFSGTIDRWASGVLFDLVNIDGQALSLKNRMQEAHGAGWTAANSMLWQCSASLIECFSPPTATNWAYGVWGQFSGNGFWYEPNSHIKPRSLFYAQLSDRMEQNVSERAQFLPVEFGSTSSPSIELAQELAKQSEKPYTLLKEWIEKAFERNPINSNTDGVERFDQVSAKGRLKPLPGKKVSIKNGWLLIDGKVITGNTMRVQWWRGSTRPYVTSHSGPHLTRYVPGRTGIGYTDDLEFITDLMLDTNILAIEHNYGLWYDRRRDDHERIRRMNGEVWPPYYELPFARSGEGIAWDGLSKYDLTKPNLWYWSRLKEFADLADQKGLILMHQNYFQHNILEAGAHWADFPWRTANNINNTDFLEPPPYAGDKRIFMAEQFYDINHPHRRELHRQYIRQCLNNFADNTNVFQMVSKEYTGPLHFVEFWLDVIIEWEKETGKNALVCLSTTKDVQDAILADPIRSKAVEIIDIRYWQYRNDGTLYAPEGGKNLAPRQHARLVKPGNISFESVYRAVTEYRNKYPEKAVIYTSSQNNDVAWAIFMAGGSMAPVPRPNVTEFLKSAATMSPVNIKKSEGLFELSNRDGEKIIYCAGNVPINIDLTSKNGSFTPIWINPKICTIVSTEKKIKGGEKYILNKTQNDALLLWLKKD